jgi:hypothetical protein
MQMAEIDGTVAARKALGVLREAVEGPSGPSTYFIDNKPDAGLLGALASIGAAEASRLWGDTTVAAHAHHIAFAMADSAAILEGSRTPPDWKESWRVTSVDDAAWKDLVARVGREYERLRRAIASRSSSSAETFGEVVGSIAHVAYHLGAIRQKIVGLQSTRR